jgi:hypothetical protein
MTEVGPVLRIEVPGLPPSANARMRAGSWPALYRATKPFKDATILLAREEMARHGRTEPMQRARVVATLVRRSGYCPRDPDSAASSLKEVLDGLVQGGVIVNDSPKHLDLEVRQERGTRAHHSYVRVEVTEVADGQQREPKGHPGLGRG